MIYKFKSKAGGDLLMLGPNGDALLRALGREPSAQGIIEPAAMAGAIQAIEQAVLADEAARAPSRSGAAADDAANPAAPGGRDGVGLRQRFWPMVELLKRASRDGVAVVWGV